VAEFDIVMSAVPIIPQCKKSSTFIWRRSPMKKNKIKLTEKELELSELPPMENTDEIKKELRVADFINLSIIYTALEFNINHYGCELTSKYAEEIRNDLKDMLDLVCSAVTLKDGSNPNNWYFPVSESTIAMSYKTAQELYDKFISFNEKSQKRRYEYGEMENILAGNMEDVQLEITVEMLRDGLAEI
jgi:hypothetical protein